MYGSYSPILHMAVNSNALRVSCSASNGVAISSHNTRTARDCTYAGCRDNTAINLVAKLIGAACLATLSSCKETSTRHSYVGDCASITLQMCNVTYSRISYAHNAK